MPIADRLPQVKATYDPPNVFNCEQSVPLAGAYERAVSPTHHALLRESQNRYRLGLCAAALHRLAG